MKITTKVILNDADAFEAVILDFLKGKKNRAGQLKKLAYDRIANSSGATLGTIQQVGTRTEETPEIKQKLAKLSAF